MIKRFHKESSSGVGGKTKNTPNMQVAKYSSPGHRCGGGGKQGFFDLMISLLKDNKYAEEDQ